jgi:putative tryptophan/tyrosine transport system substrate-binding protein
MRRREFIACLGGTAAAWSIAARAQQANRPLVGFIGTTSSEGTERWVAGFRAGLAERGFVEGRNVSVEYSWANNQYEQLPAIVDVFVRRGAAAIVLMGAANGPLAAKRVTATIPILFLVGSDPVEIGLVASLNRPGGNLTGVTTLSRELLPKRLELLRELMPNVNTVGMLINPANPNSAREVREMQALAGSGGWRVRVIAAGGDADLNGVFATLAQEQVGAFITSTDASFANRRNQIIALALHHMIPGVHSRAEDVEAGGLISYGANNRESSRQVGIYAGRILSGETPADLPVTQPIKFELAINLKTAKAIGLAVPESFLLRADEVIE